MQIKNIDTSLHKTMIAVFKKRGLSEAAATAKATKNLAEARSTFNEVQAKSAAAKPSREDPVSQFLAKRTAKAGGKTRTGLSIKITSKKITSAEQVALHKVSAPLSSRSFLMVKTGASVAIALGAVAQWARSLP